MEKTYPRWLPTLGMDTDLKKKKNIRTLSGAHACKGYHMTVVIATINKNNVPNPALRSRPHECAYCANVLTILRLLLRKGFVVVAKSILNFGENEKTLVPWLNEIRKDVEEPTFCESLCRTKKGSEQK